MLQSDRNAAGLFRSYLCLSCALDPVCVLRPDDWMRLLCLDERRGKQHIWVRQPEGCQLSVRGSKGDLPYKRAAKLFPQTLFQS